MREQGVEVVAAAVVVEKTLQLLWEVTPEELR